MGQQFLIDSNIVIDYLDGKLPTAATLFLNDVVDAIPVISVIAKIEVLGYNCPAEKYAVLTDFVNSSIVIDLIENIVSRTIEIRKQRKIKTPDAIIAATALALKLTLLTRNTTDFSGIDGLDFLDPYSL